MKLLGLKVINLASYLYLLIASFFLAGDFMRGAQEKVYVMPAPFAFSIWGLIYVLLLVFILKSFFANEEENLILKSLGLWFPISMILSGTTVTVGTTPSILFLSLSLVTLCVVYMTIQSLHLTSNKYRAPFSIYLAWTSIATIVNVFVVFQYNGIEELLSIDELGWTVIALTLGGLIAIFFHFAQKDSLYPLVFVWGYGAIFAYQDQELIKFVTGVFVVLLLFIVFFSFLQKSKK